jgi:hypothetical protein
MPRSVNPLPGNPQRLRGLVACALLLAACLLVSAAIKLSAADASTTRKTPAPTLLTRGASSSSQQEERAVIRLLTNGFSPTEVAGAPGMYRLVTTRRSRDEEITLQLKKSSGEVVQEIVVPQDKLDWTTLIEIEAGSYSLVVTGHADWVCNITVQ